MMSRFVRTVDPERRHELILFYNESVADAGYTLATISEDGGIRPAFGRSRTTSRPARCGHSLSFRQTIARLANREDVARYGRLRLQLAPQ